MNKVWKEKSIRICKDSSWEAHLGFSEEPKEEQPLLSLAHKAKKESLLHTEQEVHCSLVSQSTKPLATLWYVHSKKSIRCLSSPRCRKLADHLLDHVLTQNSTARPGTRWGRATPSDHQRPAVLAAQSAGCTDGTQSVPQSFSTSRRSVWVDS